MNPILTRLVKHFIIILFAVSTTMISYVAEANVSPDANQQLLVIISPDWNSNHAKLQRYQRSSNAWQPVGTAIDVMLGKNGIAKTKKEGDLRVPSGIFTLGTAFGFSKTNTIGIKLPYLPITNTTVCVDDLKSPYYNQIINSAQVAKTSWNSGEQMQEKVPQYTWGVTVNYNTSKPIPGAGSCIFMHVWTTPSTPTVGCIAMSEANIKHILTWLDPAKKPIVAVFPISDYIKLQELMNLPKVAMSNYDNTANK